MDPLARTTRYSLKVRESERSGKRACPDHPGGPPHRWLIARKFMMYTLRIPGGVTPRDFQ
jgi:hypothetical protein